MGKLFNLYGQYTTSFTGAKCRVGLTTHITNCSRGIRNAWHFYYALVLVFKAVCSGVSLQEEKRSYIARSSGQCSKFKLSYWLSILVLTSVVKIQNWHRSSG
ncbi:hypothetical protein CGK12_22890 [Vibrio parahaemolyticus]|nr:hypothetical protein CGK12_22890 [Vibrio parahaemolyticus]